MKEKIIEILNRNTETAELINSGVCADVVEDGKFENIANEIVKLLPIQTVTCCSRCGGEIDGDRWENGWPNYGHIHLGFAAQAFGALAGMEHTASRKHFDAWSKGHKAMTKNDAQEIVFEWGAGYKYDSTSRYRLCYNCQKELLKTIGGFFGYGR